MKTISCQPGQDLYELYIYELYIVAPLAPRKECSRICFLIKQTNKTEATIFNYLYTYTDTLVTCGVWHHSLSYIAK